MAKNTQNLSYFMYQILNIPINYLKSISNTRDVSIIFIYSFKSNEICNYNKK